MSEQQRASVYRAPGVTALSLAAAAAVVAMAGTAMAADWDGAAGTPLPFEDPVNWSDNAPPNGIANINNGGIATVSTFSGGVTRLNLGSTAGGSGTIQQSGGSISTDGPLYVAGSDTAIGSGTYDISAGSVNTGLDFMTAYNGTATFNMSGGTINTGRFMGFSWKPNSQTTATQTGGTINSTAAFWIGEGTGSTSSYTLSGGTINSGAAVAIGAHGQTTFNMSGASTVFTALGDFQIGNDHDATATFTMSDGTITLDPTNPGIHFMVGHVGKGTFNMSGGTVNASRFNMGQHGWQRGDLPGWSTDPTLHARGIVNQTGGTVNVNTAMVMGEVSGNDNQYNISAGTLRLSNTNGNTVPIIVGASGGRGTLNVSGTAVVEVDSHIFAGTGNLERTTATGAVNISGGTVELGRNIRFAPQSGVTNDPRVNLLSGGFMVIGEFGTATSNISGGDTTVDFLQLGRRNYSSSQGQGTQTGGTVEVRRSMTLGSLSPHNNFYEISAGTLNFTGTVIEPDDTPPAPAGFTGDWNAAWRNAKNKNELQPGLHVARASTGDPATEPFVPSNGRLTISGTAAVNVAGGLYNSTGFLFQPPDPTPTDPNDPLPPPVPRPGGTGLIEMNGGTLTAASFFNGSSLNPGTSASANYVQTGGTASVGHVTGTGNVTVSGGTMNVNSVRQASLSVSGGNVNVATNGTAAGTSIVNTLSISGTGKLDLRDNDLLVDYAAAGPSPEDTIRGYVKGARMAGSTTGIYSTPGSPADDKVLAVADNAEWGKTSFGSFNIDASTVVGKYTYFGDSNLDGAVTGDDYLAVDSNLGTGTSWIDGDFNMDGAVTGDDYLAIDTNLGKGTPTPLAFAELKAEMVALHAAMFGEEYLAKLALVEAEGFGTLVPEPGSVGLLAAGALGLLGRRRRQR